MGTTVSHAFFDIYIAWTNKLLVTKWAMDTLYISHKIQSVALFNRLRSFVFRDIMVARSTVIGEDMMKDKSNKRISPLGIKGSILFTIVNLIFIFVATLMFVSYSDCLKIQKAIDNGVTAEAEIVYLQNRSLSRGTYNLICRYIDENGILYECACGSGSYYDYTQTALDEQRIGEKVEIYIGEIRHGNQGICWAVSYGKDVNAKTQLAWGIVCVCLIFVMFVLLTLYLLCFYDKFPFLKRSKKE